MQTTLDDLMKAALLTGMPATTNTVAEDIDPPSLTIESVLALKQALVHLVWYIPSPYVAKGKQYCLPESRFYPEYWVIHTDDEVTFCDAVYRNGMVPRHMREWKPKISTSRFMFVPVN